MGYNTKINLTNDKVCQNSGDILTLSGNTVVASSGDIRYASNPTFTGDTQIITKKYVDDNINSLTGTTSQAVTGATNGLTKTGQDVCLGGTLDTATVFTKNGTGSLLKYASDYSSEYDAQTIPDAAYVTGLTSQSVFTSSNGITKTGQDIELGGSTPLSKVTNICGASNNMNIGTAASKIGVLNLNAGSVAILSTGSTEICPTGELTLDGSAISVKEVANYDTDKSSSYTLRSIPDVNYVTGLTSNAILTASNGLTKDGTDVKLGGTLTETTQINPQTNSLCIGYNNNYICTNTGRTAIQHMDNISGCYSYFDIKEYGTAIYTERGSDYTNYDQQFCRHYLNSCVGDNSSCFIIDGKGCIDTNLTCGMRFSSTSGCSIIYGGDYESNFVNRSLVTKQYVDGEINNLTGTTSQSITGATNGLTKDGQDVKLGGTLTENTTISGGTNTLTINNLSCVEIAGNHSYGGEGKLIITDTYTKLQQDYDGNNTGYKLLLSPYTSSPEGDYASFFDYTTDGHGLQYGGCYSSGFTSSCSLVDKGYVDNAVSIVSSSITGATNGLTKSGQDVCLGGSLITDTIINLNNGNCFQLCDTGNNADYIFDLTGITLNNNDSIFKIGNSGDDYILTHCSGSNINLSLSGLTYGGDYSANFKPNTLVTKDYVDNATGGIDANNGLTREGANIVLGGALTGDTDISGTNTLLISAPHEACDIQYFKFDNSPSISGHEEGRLFYDNCQLNFQRETSGVTTQLGEEQVVRVENVTGTLISNGSVVYVDGVSLTSGLPTIGLADSTDFIKATQTVGVATQDIPNNSEGYVTVLGAVHDVNTNGYAVGSLIWLSTGGTFTDTRPSYPEFSVNVGIVEKQGTTDGQIYARILYVPNYTEYGLFTGYTASTLTTLNNKLDTTTFNSYTGITDGRLDVIEPITDVAITGVTNGLTKVGSHSACFGGTLANNTTLSGTRLLTLGDLNGICMSVANTNDIALNAKSNGAIYLKSQSGTVASSSDMTNAVGISIDYNASIPMLVTDNRPTPRGLQYADDYTSSFVDRSLVDKYYVDSIATGLNVHGSVVAATTPSGGNIALSGLTTVDGISLSIGDRVLVKNQTDGALNGIYSANTGVWSRTEDYNFEPTGEVSNGDLIPVISGTTNHNSQWILTTPNPITSGDTLTFSLFSQQQGIIEGEGICVETVGTNKQVRVKLSPSEAGLCFDTDALELDYNIYTCGLDTSTAGEVRVCTTSDAVTGDEISVKIGSNNELVVDRDDFSYTTAANGLSKEGCNVVLGGQLTGNTTIGGNVCAYNLTFNDLNDFNIGFSDNSIITDYGVSPSGLEYGDDYSNTFVDNSLVTKYFVNNAITGNTLTYCDGLTKTNDIIQWGGSMTTDRALLRSTSNFCVKSTGIDIINDCGCVLTTSSNIDLRTCTTSTSCDASIGLTNTGAMSIVANNASTGLTITAPAVGAVYAADYSGSFVDNSLVTKKYVDDSSGGITASNGLNRIGNDIELGGILDKTTTISGATQEINFGTTGSQLGFFNVDSSCSIIVGDKGKLYFDALGACMQAYTDAGNQTEIALDDYCGIGITVAGTTDAMFYAGDYHSLYNLRTIPDVDYVTGITSTIQTDLGQAITGATNGLTKSGQDVKLGGTLTENTTIDGGLGLCIGETTPLDIFRIYSSNLSVIGSTDGTNISKIEYQPNLIQLCSTISGTSNCIALNDGAIGIADNINSIGAIYAGDYENNFTARSLVTKQYVDSEITGTTNTFNNGLTESGGIVSLGGILTGDTTIGGGSNNLYLSTVNFNVGSTGANINTSSGCLTMNAVAGSSLIWNNTDSSFCVNTKDVSFTNGIENTSFIFNGDATVAGFYYGDDYTTGGTPTDRWLTDKGYVDNAITGATNTFINGLTDNAGTVELGGDLTKDTCIDTKNLYGVAIGCDVIASGNNSFALGQGYGGGNVIASGNESFAGGFGYYGGVKAAGLQSFAFGGDYTHACGVRSAVLGGSYNCITLVGHHSVIIGGSANEIQARCSGIFGGNSNTIFTDACNSFVIGGYGVSIDGSCSSATLGGRVNQLNTNNHCSVILGGCNINVGSGELPEHAIVPNLAIWNTPADDNDGAILVWDSSTKKVGKTTIAALGGVTGGTNGLGVNGQDICLGGTLISNTTINNNKHYNVLIGNLDDTYLDLQSGSYIEIGSVSGNSYITVDGSVDNDYIEMSTQNGSWINIDGLNDEVTIRNNNNTEKIIIRENSIDITGTITLQSTPASGSAITDSVLVWNSTDKKVKQVDASNLGEDNNNYDMTVVTTNVTLTTGSTYVQLVNSPTSGVTITLPASPIDGQVFRIKDAAGTALDYNITIARNGNLIDGVANDGVLNTDSGALEVVYNNTLGSWYVFSFVN